MDHCRAADVTILLLSAVIAFAFATAGQSLAAITVTVLGGLLAACMAEHPRRPAARHRAVHVPAEAAAETTTLPLVGRLFDDTDEQQPGQRHDHGEQHGREQTSEETHVVWPS
jgi:hypothetical protein